MKAVNVMQSDKYPPVEARPNRCWAACGLKCLSVGDKCVDSLGLFDKRCTHLGRDSDFIHDRTSFPENAAETLINKRRRLNLS